MDGGKRPQEASAMVDPCSRIDRLEREKIACDIFSSTSMQLQLLLPTRHHANIMKIIPLDSLTLELDASRNARLKNAVGRKKQSLVVVASLVDKIPNLAGLARTSEIFAAERLVIPDTSVCKMDNFKSISVTAGDWLDIEGCKEDVSALLLSFCMNEPLS